jgi:spore maturation protein CgeB
VTGRRVLLLSPAFHGYDAAIAEAFASRGHEVVVHRYDHLPDLTARVGHHLRHELPKRLRLTDSRRLRTTRTELAVASLARHRPDAVVVVKGDQFTDDFWQALDESALPRVLWLYDELRRTGHDLETLRRIGPIATYSKLDAAALRDAGIEATHLPLAYDHRRLPTPPAPSVDEVVFVGARYSSREATLVALAAAGVPVRAFGRDWSGHPVDRLRTWAPRRPAVPAGRDLDRLDAYRRMAESAATLNLHGDQDGFTMRTFEACGVGGVQLIDRTDVGDLYEPGVELAPYATPAELLDLCERARRDRSWASGLRSAGRRRTLAEHTFDHRVRTLESMWA